MAVPPLVMMANNLGDLCVAVNPRKDVLADLRVGLHQTSLRESKGAGLIKQAIRQSDLANVVDKTAKVRQPLSFFRESETCRNVSRVDGHGCRLAGIPRVSRINRGRPTP